MFLYWVVIITGVLKVGSTFVPCTIKTLAVTSFFNCAPTTLRQFRDKNSKESSVREWKKAYPNEVNEKCKSANLCTEVFVMALPSKKRGRPPVLGEKLDKYLQEAIAHTVYV